MTRNQWFQLSLDNREELSTFLKELKMAKSVGTNLHPDEQYFLKELLSLEKEVGSLELS